MASFPANGTKQGLFVVDSFEQQVFVAHASRAGTNPSDRDLYISGRQGLSYSSSLEAIVYLPSSNSRGVVDFTPIESMRGVYIANHFVVVGFFALVSSSSCRDDPGEMWGGEVGFW